MKSKSNMDRAKHFQKWFWIATGPAIASLFLGYWIQGPFGPTGPYAKAFTGLPLLLGCVSVGQMAGCGFRVFRSLRQEIADLKSGDADDSTATQDSE